MPTVLESLQSFLAFQANAGVAPDLLGRWNTCMETQVNVSSAGGEQVDDRPNCWTNGTDTWWPIRVPKQADSEPVFKDYRLDWPLDLYASEIGCTGYDWVNRRSRWVGFDFDAITGHAAGVGISDDELAAVRDKACALPWVEVRKSTGGAGLHLYVFVDVETANHTEHAAVARAVLARMTSETGFDFARHVDCCGGNLWIWRRGLTADHPGLSLIKAATETLGDIPNWRDHVDVVRRKRTKTKVGDDVEALARAHKLAPLDDEHRALVSKLDASRFACNWIHDHSLLQTHTKGLAEVYEAGEIEGVFATTSRGDDPATPNCFMFPLTDGAWRVYRFSPGVSEAPTWNQDGQNWTTCVYNRRPSLAIAAKFCGAAEDPDNGEFVCSPEVAAKVAAILGERLELPFDREIRLAKSKQGRLLVKFEKLAGDETPTGYIAKKRQWVRGFDVAADAPRDPSLFEYDHVLRQLISATGDHAGWVAKNFSGQWCSRNKDDVKSLLSSMGVVKADQDSVLGEAIYRPWKLVNIPFQSEYPGDRQWNLDAAQFRYLPEEGVHPHWDLVMAHLGRDLDGDLKNLRWAIDANVRTGGDYLKAWIACMFREPFQPLPYLFFWGPENSGKSLFFESISELVTKGVVSAFNALTSRNDFNGDIAGAILCYIDEKDITKAPGARDRMKEWVTGKMIPIRKMRMDTYMQVNTTHWCQCANSPRYCPISPNDTRITMIHVAPPEAEIPKDVLLDKLRSEAPAFMATLLDLNVPHAHGRLRLPMVVTEGKRRMEDLGVSPLSRFLEENVRCVAGAEIPFAEFCERIDKTLDNEERIYWTPRRISGSLPREYSTRRGAQGKRFLVNAEWK